MNSNHIGSSFWPTGVAGIANPYPTRRRGHIVLLAPLTGTLEVGALKLPPGAAGVHPLSGSEDGLPTLYLFADADDVQRVVFVTR